MSSSSWTYDSIWFGSYFVDADDSCVSSDDSSYVSKCGAAGARCVLAAE